MYKLQILRAIHLLHLCTVTHGEAMVENSFNMLNVMSFSDFLHSHAGVFVDISEEALIASPGFPFPFDSLHWNFLWLVVSPVGTQLVINVEAVLIDAELTIGHGYLYNTNSFLRKATMFESVKVTSPSNSLTLRYESRFNGNDLGFIAHVTSAPGMVLISLQLGVCCLLAILSRLSFRISILVKCYLRSPEVKQ